jgi:hypothetical protein
VIQQNRVKLRSLHLKAMRVFPTQVALKPKPQRPALVAGTKLRAPLRHEARRFHFLPNANLSKKVVPMRK